MRKAILSGLLLGLLVSITQPLPAQTATVSSTVSWTAPTKNTDGSVISGTITYNLYQGSSGGTFTKVASSVTGTSDVVTSLAAGSCFAVTAVVAGAESGLSNTACLAIPGPPGSTTVTLTVTIH